MKLFCITGASRGLGLALSKALTDRHHALFLVARSACTVEHDVMKQVTADLSDAGQMRQMLRELKLFAAPLDVESVTLINNAGTVEPVRAAMDCSAEALSQNIQLNLLAPVLLSTGVLRLFHDVPRLIVNISSGAAHSPYHGWSAYCASKAGLDHFNRCLGLELANNHVDARTVSIAPGVIDTQMQDVIRSARVKDFPSIDKFLRLKDEGALLSPDEAAGRLLKFLSTGQFDNGGVYDLRQV